MQLAIVDGQFTETSVAEACRDYANASRGRKSEFITQRTEYHMAVLGEWGRRQLAVALDISHASLPPHWIGGPLPLARLARVSIDQACDYLVGQAGKKKEKT